VLIDDALSSVSGASDARNAAQRAAERRTRVRNRVHAALMALRRCAAGMREASKQFRRVNGHLHLAALRVALDDHFDVSVTLARDDEEAA
jgi:hypothetical protein